MSSPMRCCFSCKSRAAGHPKMPSSAYCADCQPRSYVPYESQKEWAYRVVRAALKSGVLARPSACERCGQPNPSIHGHHHHGYARPLDVVWLCPRCHRRSHPGKGALIDPATISVPLDPVDAAIETLIAAPSLTSAQREHLRVRLAANGMTREDWAAQGAEPAQTKEGNPMAIIDAIRCDKCSKTADRRKKEEAGWPVLGYLGDDGQPRTREVTTKHFCSTRCLYAHLQDVTDWQTPASPEPALA